MLSLTLNSKRKRNFFLGQNQLFVEADFEAHSEFKISKLLEVFFDEAKDEVPLWLKNEGREVENIRGRSPETLGRANLDAVSREEELLYLRGFNLSEESEEEPSSFSLRVDTKFLRFDGSEAIVHSILPRSEFNFSIDSSVNSVRLLLKSYSLKVEQVRFGVEIFGSHFFNAMFGSTPTVRTKFYLEADREEFKVKIIDAGVLSVETMIYLKALDKALAENGLFDGFLRQVVAEVN